jgi:glycosyltransferase involved in cell wall biosynthesis
VEHAAAVSSQPVRLSQCMIVKNEEKNIERALSWAKEIAFEQIVVDTGSTDRTVEIAESLGAKVFHFEWINDFAAAKNFAIEKARGNWIAFLDADEYFTEEHTQRLKKHLKNIQRENASQNVGILECRILQLRDNGEVFLVNLQRRVFRNNGTRYVGRIHEQIEPPQGQYVRLIEDIEIMHTGYTQEAITSTNKQQRNIDLLREELERNPDNATIKGYLADSLLLNTQDQDARQEAARLYREVIEDGNALPNLLKNAYSHVFSLEFRGINTQNCGKILEFLGRAKKALPDVPDYPCYAGKCLFIIGKYAEAWENYMLFEQIIAKSKQHMSSLTADDIVELYHDMARTALELGDIENGIKYTSITLSNNKYSEDTLINMMLLLEANLKAGIINDGEKLDRLKQFYDFNNPKDKLFLTKCAKAAKDTVLMLFFYKSITAADRAALSAESA